MSERAGHARVLTWNIHAPARRRGLDRVVELVRKHDPDIVALQEVDSRGRAGEHGPFGFLSAALGAHAAEARTISAPDGHYGHVVISRWPLADIVLHNISVSRREPRMAIQVEVETPYGSLHVAAVHLGLQVKERSAQAVMIAAFCAAPEETTLVVGDFNEWYGSGAVARTLKDLFPARTPHRTFPARLPLLRLDRIYCRPHQAMVRSWTDLGARGISDHLPVIADVRIVDIAGAQAAAEACQLRVSA